MKSIVSRTELFTTRDRFNAMGSNVTANLRRVSVVIKFNVVQDFFIHVSCDGNMRVSVCVPTQQHACAHFEIEARTRSIIIMTPRLTQPITCRMALGNVNFVRLPCFCASARKVLSLSPPPVYKQGNYDIIITARAERRRRASRRGVLTR